MAMNADHVIARRKEQKVVIHQLVNVYATVKRCQDLRINVRFFHAIMIVIVHQGFVGGQKKPSGLITVVIITPQVRFIV